MLADGRAMGTVGFVTGTDLDPDTLRRDLGRSLPDYMIPSRVVLDEMPLDGNGKIERPQLASPLETVATHPGVGTAHDGRRGPSGRPRRIRILLSAAPAHSGDHDPAFLMASTIRKVLARPGDAVRLGLALSKGWYCKAYYRLRGQRFSAGRGLRVFGQLSIRGPGRVEFGDDVTVWLWTSPWTASPDAVIRVGDRVRLSGVRITAKQEISIGRESLLAECRVMDSDFHPITPNRRDPDAVVRTVPVHIGENTWIAPQAAIMPGTTIGDNSVVSFGSICSGAFPANVVIVGNPARIAGKIPAVVAISVAGGASGNGAEITPRVPPVPK